MDGIFADFVQGFNLKLAEVTGRSLFPADFEATCWDWAVQPGLYTNDEAGKAQQAIEEDKKFWRNLNCYPDTPDAIARIWNVQRAGHDAYFITNRPGVDAKRQTETWLYQHSTTLVPVPTVLITPLKGCAAQALQLDAYIDDKPSNCRDVVKFMGLHCKTFLLDRPWNQDDHDKYITRVFSIGDMLDRLGL